MRRSLAAVVAVVAALSLVGTAAASAPTKKKPPVKLSGKVNDMGTKTVTNGSIVVEQDDFYFKPTFIKGNASETVTVQIKNEGQNKHSFTIPGQSIDKVVRPGNNVTVQITIPADGKPVAFYCRFHGGKHPSESQYGMQGAFFSKTGTTAKSTSGGSSKGSGYGY